MNTSSDTLTNEGVSAAAVVQAIRTVVGPGPAALHEPTFRGNESKYVQECIDSTFVSSVGKFVDRFERDLEEYTSAARAVAVCNGTAALHVALLLAGVQRDEEVLAPALSFVATANAIAYCGAVPHFVEADEQRLGIEPEQLREYLESISSLAGGRCVNRRTGRIIRAMVPMHTFGHMVDIDRLLAIAHDFHLVLIEDAAESLGSTLGGRHAGTFGLLGVLSFNGNKTVTTGGGGAVLTNDEALGRRAKHLTTTAKLPHRWDFVHDETGYNYRLPNLNAALGCAQLEQLPGFVHAKRLLHDAYREAFADVAGVSVVREPEGTRSNYWLQTLRLDEASAAARDAILTATNDAGLMTRPVWTLMHHLPPYASCPRMPLDAAESLAARLINVPSSAHLMLDRAS